MRQLSRNEVRVEHRLIKSQALAAWPTPFPRSARAMCLSPTALQAAWYYRPRPIRRPDYLLGPLQLFSAQYAAREVT